MGPPRLTFFCELEAQPLQALLNEAVLADLLALRAQLSLAILDLSPERASVVRSLNQAGIPVTAWLLLPKEQGYWFNLDNAPLAAAMFAAFIDWTTEHGLEWAQVGLDFEPDIRDVEEFAARGVRMLPKLFRKAFSWQRLEKAQAVYRSLVADIHAAGYRVESYHHPFIVDERQAGSTLLRRFTGLVDIPVDKEVWMLYSSQNRPLGLGLLGSYAPAAPAIGIGSTGGGIQIGLVDDRPLNWAELARDLRLAWHWSDDLYIFSLEGCVQSGFFDRLKSFEWDLPILLPTELIGRMNGLRKVLRTFLWISANLGVLLASGIGAGVLVLGLRRFLRDR